MSAKIIKEEIHFDDGTNEVLFDNTTPIPTYEDLVGRRNALFARAESAGGTLYLYEKLGIANRHLIRIELKTHSIDQLRSEIVDCLDRAQAWLDSL